MTRRLLTLFSVFLLAGSAAYADEENKAEKLAALARQLSPSLVQVEYTLQYDKGQAPGSVDQWRSWLSWQRAGSAVAEQDWEQWDQLIREERPAQRGGYLISPTTVITTDPLLHPRFVKDISVRFGDTVRPAVIRGYGTDHNELFLEISEPFANASPLTFDLTADGPYYAMTYALVNGSWRTHIEAIGSSVSVTTDGQEYKTTTPGAIIVTSDGTAVGTSGNGRLAIDDSWKQQPENSPKVSDTDLQARLLTLKTLCNKSLPRVSLHLRSPRSKQESRYSRYSGYGSDSNAELTEWHGTGVVIQPDLVLILANLKPKVTARLERIQLYTTDGESRSGEFVATLKDFGGFLARVDAPFTDVVTFADGEILQYRDQFLLKSEIAVHGEDRTAYYGHDRIPFLVTGRHGNVYPAISATGDGTSGGHDSESSNLKFLYTLDGALVAMPFEHRQKVTVQSDWNGDELRMTPARLITDVLTSTDDHTDPENRPLSEDDENRLAWLGVELQPMDLDLARASNITDLTRGGKTGAIVTYVYPKSPAEEAGLKMGDVILRLDVEGQPKPLEVELTDSFYGFEGFPWQYLDQVPEEYFDQMPRPWGSVENTLTRSLTDLGFGTPFTAEIHRNGELVYENFTVAQGPKHYDSAPRFKTEDLGLTVRDMTYEVRRYFQLADDDPGVIISKIEKGSKAAVAGIKPFEIILSVNGKMIMNASDFEEAASQSGELRLSVKRMHEGRLVKIKSAGSGEDQMPLDEDFEDEPLEEPVIVDDPTDIQDSLVIPD